MDREDATTREALGSCEGYKTFRKDTTRSAKTESVRRSSDFAAAGARGSICWVFIGNEKTTVADLYLATGTETVQGMLALVHSAEKARDGKEPGICHGVHTPDADQQER